MDVLQKFLSVGSIHKFQKYFEDSLILQLYWENEFDLIEGPTIEQEKQITFLSLIRKFVGKKIREKISMLRSIKK